MRTAEWVWEIRTEFPALSREIEGKVPVFLDGPGGSQVPRRVLEAMAAAMIEASANTHGAFPTSRRLDALIAEARQAAADLVGASPEEIVFGPNMTTLTFHISRAIGRILRPGDEIVVTRLDHDANVAPWLALEERGAVIRWVDFHPEDGTLDLEGLARALSERTRLVAVGYASNALGTVNPVRRIVEMAHAVGAWVYVDAVHAAPHLFIDVQELECDFLVCSAYKFFGPHVGFLYGRADRLTALRPYKVRPAPDQPPEAFETGTQNHEGLAGLIAAVDYLADLGRRFGNPINPSQRAAIRAAMERIREHERALCARLLEGLEEIPSVTVYGIRTMERWSERVPTLSFRAKKWDPREIATALGQKGIYVWDGNFYALGVTERLGLEGQGGLVRVGALHYNTLEEVNRFLETLHRLLSRK
ncbi:cysteine desulfurase-like protein [Thermoflexus sp.]|uniref:cysteine desulfurase-like protein n=1 Tax=Thermoflexus sp. TaxID=1969742 RepID=UPI00260CC9FA|nr:cysteine desulfurase-like protein [Thermoflexus sp.]MCX7689838.1 cysteine desulfurase-like protein [Thermoflexus sp.]